jgi:hypothetical protein
MLSRSHEEAVKEPGICLKQAKKSRGRVYKNYIKLRGRV